MEFKDYYATLGVTKTATEKDLKQAYRKLARKYHPDVNPNNAAAEAKFKEINEAHEVLGDPAKRKKYDELGANWRMYKQAGPGPQSGAWSPPTGGRGARTMSEDELRDMLGGADPFSDFFHTFFGGAMGGQPNEGPRGRQGARSRAERPGRDLEHEMNLSLDDAAAGATRRISVTHQNDTRTVDVRIPAGVSDGARVRVAGEGERGVGGGRAGDLYLRVHILPHASFEPRGKDLYTHVALPLTTAVLGGEVDVRTLSGKSLRLKVPPATQNGQVFRLKGHGMPTTGKPDQMGNLYATADVQLPRTLTPEQREHFEALQALERKARS